jgi:hypothetical protein
LLDIGLAGWAVPAVALAVPGILLVIVVSLQLLGGAAWLPIARRMLSRAARVDGPASGRQRRRSAGR